MDHATFVEWIDLEVEGQLPASDALVLATHLEECEACRGERATLQALASRLAGDRVEVRPGFSSALLAALPSAGWESRHPRTWGLPLLALLALAGTSAALFGTSAARLSGETELLGALGALGGLVGSALLAGSGLAGASWQGLGLAVGDLLGRSPSNLAAAVVLVASLNLLLVRLLRRPRPAAPAAARGRR